MFKDQEDASRDDNRVLKKDEHNAGLKIGKYLSVLDDVIDFNTSVPTPARARTEKQKLNDNNYDIL